MKVEKFKGLEAQFLAMYPEGFDSEEMKEAGKKHKVSQMEDLAKVVLSKEELIKYNAIDGITKLITRSSLVSVFEKTRFRNLVLEADEVLKKDIVDSVYEMIHINQHTGFDRLSELLHFYKMAKWPILSVLLFYLDGTKEVLIKPTTVKKVLSFMEVTDIVYSTKPNYAFYNKYRTFLNNLKKKADPRLSNNNGAFQAVFMILLD